MIKNDQMVNQCACKGIRKCALCAPTLVEKEKQDEEILLSSDNVNNKKLYLFCPKCNQAVLLSKDHRADIENFIKLSANYSLKCFCQQVENKNIIKINGIFILNDFLNLEEEEFLMKQINKTEWISSQSGRFKQDYGPQANFNRKKIKTSKFTGLPYYSKFLLDRLKSNKMKIFDDFNPVELCNLKYDNERASCIDPHFDDAWLWGERLITISLLANTYYTLTPGNELLDLFGECEIFVPIERLSLIVLSNDARYKWKHSIKKSHIKSIRIAITLRELSNEFKIPSENGLNGKIIENLALSFKGISTGTLEKMLENMRNLNEFQIIQSNIELDDNLLNILKNEINLDFYKLVEKRNKNLIIKTEKSFIHIRKLENDKEKEILEKFRVIYYQLEHKPNLQTLNFTYLKNYSDFVICIQDNCDQSSLAPVNFNETILVNIGKKIAEWREFSIEHLNMNEINDGNMQPEYDFNYFLDLTKNQFKSSCLKDDSTFKAKFIALIVSSKNLIENAEIDLKLDLQKGIILNDFNIEKIHVSKTNEIIFSTTFQNLKHSYFLNDLASCQASLILSIFLIEKNDSWRSVYKNLLNGYEELYKLTHFELEFLNRLILINFLVLIFDLKKNVSDYFLNEQFLDIFEYFYLNSNIP